MASINQWGDNDGPDMYELVFGIGELSVLVWVYLGFSMGITLYCSIAITVRIFKICRLGGTSVKSYASVLEVVAESSALYTTVVLITFILVFVSERWGSRYAVAVLLSVTVRLLPLRESTSDTCVGYLADLDPGACCVGQGAHR